MEIIEYILNSYSGESDYRLVDYPVLMSAKITTTVFGLLTLIFLYCNLHRHKDRIFKNFTLIAYYVAGITVCICDIIMTWTLTKLNTMVWIVPFQIATLFSAIMAMSYALVMFELTRKIKIIHELVDPKLQE